MPKRVWQRTGGAALSMVRPGNVVMLHQHRCGSTVLGGMLGAHPSITWRHEIITFDMLRYEREHGSIEGWTCDPPKLIRRNRRAHPRGWFLCEVTTRNAQTLGLSLESTLDMLHRLGFTRFIVLERRNHLRRYVSSRIGKARGKLHLNPGETAEHVTVSLDPRCTGMSRDRSPLLDRIRRDCEEPAKLLELTRPIDPLHLVYEDDIYEDPTVAYAKTCAWLGLETVPVEPSLKKTSPQPLRELIENFDEVAAELSGTPYEWMLEA